MDLIGTWVGSSHFWIFLAIVVLGVGGAILGRRRERKLAAELQQAAHARGWNYIHRDRSYLNRYSGGAPFGRGSSRDVRHVLHGAHRGRHVTVFQYQYTESSGSGGNRSSTTYYHLVAAVDLPAPRPKLEVGKENLGSKVLGFFGKRDLQLESEEFNKRFRIETDNERFAYDILHPRMMEWMLADGRANAWPFRFLGADLLSWHTGKANFANMVELVDYVCDVADTVPAFVWNT